MIAVEALYKPQAGIFEPGDEQWFKTWHMGRVETILGPRATAFQIENEEKEPGFPDVLIDIEGGAPLYIEYKVSDARGVVKFQRAQPLFYKSHPRMPIYVVVYSVPEKDYTVFPAALVLSAMTARYKEKPLTLRISKGVLS